MRILTIIAVGILVILWSGCSRDLTRITQPDLEIADEYSLPVGVSDVSPDGSPAGGMGMLGLFNLNIDPANENATLTPLRQTSLTDVLEVVDLTNFMELSPCTDCVKIRSISMNSDGNPVLSIGIKHPFAAGDAGKPITGKNRADLHVFNIEGIVVSNINAESFTGIGRSIAGFRLANADGYTGYLDGVLDEIYPTEADIHPYILHFDDYSSGNFDPANPTGFLSVTTPPPSGNLVMPMGCDYNFQDYVFDLPNEPVNFIYAVGCTYGLSAETKSERFTPEYRVPQHNKKAASEVHVEVVQNNLIAGETTSTAELSVKVLDMNHGVTVGGNLDQMAYDSSVSAISVEIPGITSGTVSSYTFIGGEGRNPANPLDYSITITNDAGALGGIYQGLVKVLDSYPVNQNEAPMLHGNDGISRVDPLANPHEGLFNISEFATYATFKIEVGFTPEDPVAIIQTTPDPADVGNSNTKVIFDGSSSYDPDGGSITLFEWDFIWDGNPLNFSPDISGLEPVINYNYPCVAGAFTAALRVTDDDTPAGVSEIVSVPVTVTDDHTDGTWGTHINLGDESIHGDTVFATSQMINLDTTGIVHLFSRAGSYEIRHRTWDGTTMSPYDVAVTATGSISIVASLIDSQDELHLTWIQYSAPRVAVYHTRTVNGVFTGTNELLYQETDTNYFNTDLTTAINKDDHIMAAWINYDWDKVDCHYMYALDTGSGFGLATDMPYEVNIRLADTPNPSYVTPGMNHVTTPDGRFHYFAISLPADLTYPDTLYHYVYDGTNWAPRVQIYATSWGIVHPQVVADYDGDIHLSVRIPPLGTSNMRYSRFDHDTQTWSPLLYVAQDARGFQYGDVEIDRNGFVYVTYCSNVDDLLRMKVFCEFAEQTDLDAIPIQQVDTTCTYNSDIDMAWDAQGNLIALYQDKVGSDYYLYFNVYRY